MSLEKEALSECSVGYPIRPQRFLRKKRSAKPVYLIISDGGRNSDVEHHLDYFVCKASVSRERRLSDERGKTNNFEQLYENTDI